MSKIHPFVFFFRKLQRLVNSGSHVPVETSQLRKFMEKSGVETARHLYSSKGRKSLLRAGSPEITLFHSNEGFSGT
jgi:hypothetical protein